MDTTLKKSIDEIHQHIIGCAHEIIKSLIQDGIFNARIANELLLYGSQLFKLLPEVSRPDWLSLILEFNGKELRSSHTLNLSYEFSVCILSNFRDIESPILMPDDLNYNFDLAFDDARETENIPASFDNLISRLEAIIATDLIDSRVVQQSLEKLMVMLKRNRHGSLTSILVSLHYGRFAMKAFEGVLSANKYLKPLLEAFKEEFAVAETKVQKAEATLKEKAIRGLINEDRLMAYLAQNGGDASTVAGYLTANCRSNEANE
jgi:hypothetical protein